MLMQASRRWHVAQAGRPLEWQPAVAALHAHAGKLQLQRQAERPPTRSQRYLSTYARGAAPHLAGVSGGQHRDHPHNLHRHLGPPPTEGLEVGQPLDGVCHALGQRNNNQRHSDPHPYSHGGQAEPAAGSQRFGEKEGWFT